MCNSIHLISACDVSVRWTIIKIHLFFLSKKDSFSCEKYTFKWLISLSKARKNMSLWALPHFVFSRFFYMTKKSCDYRVTVEQRQQPHVSMATAPVSWNVAQDARWKRERERNRGDVRGMYSGPASLNNRIMLLYSDGKYSLEKEKDGVFRSGISAPNIAVLTCSVFQSNDSYQMEKVNLIFILNAIWCNHFTRLAL